MCQRVSSEPNEPPWIRHCILFVQSLQLATALGIWLIYITRESVIHWTSSNEVSAIFSEGFGEALGTGVYFRWMVHWNVGYKILFSVKGSLKQCIRKSNFSEPFVNYIKLNIVFQWSTAFVFAVSEWVAVSPSDNGSSHINKVTNQAL